MKWCSLLFLILPVLYVQGENFPSFQRYIATLPENVKSDNHDWIDPDYTTFHKTLEPLWGDKLLQFFHLKKKPLWDIQEVKSVLKELLDRKKFLEKAPYVVNITAAPGTKFIVWGDVFGAFHSLFRDIEYLVEQGVLDSELRITQHNYYLIFLGDVIDRSPYGLETFHIVLLLMQRNPEKVFYLRGKHETNDFWKNFGLRREINMLLAGREYEKNH